jgi:hypothetical protein
MDDLLGKISRWYDAHCNDNWEHHEGISIESIDNPGWSLRVGLRDTELFGREFLTMEVQRSDRDWLVCRIVDETFEGVGGPANLPELIQTFLSWAEMPREE